MAENIRRQSDNTPSSRERDDRQWRDSDYENRGRGYSSQLSDDRRYDSDYRENRGYGNEYGGSYSSDYDRGQSRYSRQSDNRGNWESSSPYGYDSEYENRGRYGRQSWDQGQRGYGNERGYGSERGYGGYASEYMSGRSDRGNRGQNYGGSYGQEPYDEWRNPEYNPRQEYQRTRYNRGWEPENSNYRDSWEPSYGQGRTGHDYSYGEGMMGQGIYGNSYSQGRQSTSYGSRNIGSDSQGNYGSRRNNRGRGPIGYRRSDERITEDINDRLSDDDMLDASSIEVKVNNGEVILSGTVENRQDKRRAEDIAEQVSGISNVENHLRVGSSSDRSSSDRRSSSNSSSENNESNRNRSNKTATTT